jgi:hypothetical protein
MQKPRLCQQQDLLNYLGDLLALVKTLRFNRDIK